MAFEIDYNHVYQLTTYACPHAVSRAEESTGLAACKDTSKQNEERATQLFEYRSVS